MVRERLRCGVLSSRGGETDVITDAEACIALKSALATLDQQKDIKTVLIVPPDITRPHSRAGILTKAAYDYYGERITDIMPALGTHAPMSSEQISRMFPGVPHSLFRVHAWRDDVVRVGEVSGEYVRQVSEGISDQSWPAELNKLVAHGAHDVVISIGQVVPHEVVGMANYTKNLLIGTGGKSNIDLTHYIGAAYGTERIMGRSDTPVRRILDHAFETCCKSIPTLFVLTVVGKDHGSTVTRGLYIGDSREVYENACTVARNVNLILLDEPIKKAVVYLDPSHFSTTWLGNKAVYRLRMALDDNAELIILAPGVKNFGEDPGIDALIRKYGYRGSRTVQECIKNNEDLAGNLSAAAHLIHGSSEGRFRIRWCAGGLSKDDVEAVGYDHGNCAEMLEFYKPATLMDGFNTINGEKVFFVSDPGLGLWAARSCFSDTPK